MRRFICCAVLSLLLCVKAGAVGTSAASAILMDAGSGRVLYAYNADQPRLIASITKIMTALVALEYGDVNEVYTVKESDMAEGSSMYLAPGEKLTLTELLYGLMLPSGNDAALAVAHCVSGSVEDFVALMNEKAVELGMTASSFANPSGLDHEDHHASARDMAVLTAYAMKNETFRRIVSTKSVTIGNRTLYNHNKLLNDGCIGVKTGYTKAAGRTLVSAKERNGQLLIAVTLCDGDDWRDHRALLDYGFTSYPLTGVVEAQEQVSEISVKGSSVTVIPVVAARGSAWPLSGEEQAEVCCVLPAAVAAPIEAGAVVGEAIITLRGQELDRVPLLCGEGAAMTATIRK